MCCGDVSGCQTIGLQWLKELSVGANNLLQILKGEEGPVCALRGKMVPHDGPDGQDDGCGDNNSHEGGPEQPHLLQVGRETDP